MSLPAFDWTHVPDGYKQVTLSVQNHEGTNRFAWIANGGVRCSPFFLEVNQAIAYFITEGVKPLPDDLSTTLK